MLDILLNSIGESTISDRNTDQEGATTISRRQCENEMYQLLPGTHFMMKMQDINTKLYNCPLSWWKSSAHQFKNLKGLLSSILQFLQHLLHLSISEAKLQESSLFNKIGCWRRLLLQ
jgi:hypothetical protein